MGIKIFLVAMKRHIKSLWVLAFLTPFLGAIGDEPSKTVEGQVAEPIRSESTSQVSNEEAPVPREQMDDTSFREPPRFVLIPVFEKGKWTGYRSEALTPERSPASVVDEPAAEDVTPKEVTPVDPTPPAP